LPCGKISIGARARCPPTGAPPSILWRSLMPPTINHRARGNFFPFFPSRFQSKKDLFGQSSPRRGKNGFPQGPSASSRDRGGRNDHLGPWGQVGAGGPMGRFFQCPHPPPGGPYRCRCGGGGLLKQKPQKLRPYRFFSSKNYCPAEPFDAGGERGGGGGAGPIRREETKKLIPAPPNRPPTPPGRGAAYQLGGPLLLPPPVLPRGRRLKFQFAPFELKKNKNPNPSNHTFTGAIMNPSQAKKTNLSPQFPTRAARTLGGPAGQNKGGLLGPGIGWGKEGAGTARGNSRLRTPPATGPGGLQYRQSFTTSKRWSSPRPSCHLRPKGRWASPEGRGAWGGRKFPGGPLNFSVKVWHGEKTEKRSKVGNQRDPKKLRHSKASCQGVFSGQGATGTSGGPQHPPFVVRTGVRPQKSVVVCPGTARRMFLRKKNKQGSVGWGKRLLKKEVFPVGGDSVRGGKKFPRLSVYQREGGGGGGQWFTSAGGKPPH